MENIESLATDAIQWALEAGDIHLSYFRTNRLDIRTKSNVHDVVTAADNASEEFLLKNIAAHYPDHSILGEESGNHPNNGDYRWVIDPLDGTNNFSQGLPVFCVSIGIQYKGETIIGVVYAPYLKELYTAIKGKGAFMNDMPLHVSGKTELDRSVIGTGFPYDKDSHPDNNTDNVTRILPRVRGLRRMGAAAYDLCCVAAGWLDAYWELNLHPWDVCAGILITEEAGGHVISFREDRGIAIVAGNETLVQDIKRNLDDVAANKNRPA